MLIHGTLTNHAANSPDKPALITPTERLTYKQLNTKTDRLATKLAAITELGDKVVINLSDPIQNICFLLAAAKAGLVSVVVDYQLSGRDYQQLIEEAEPEFIIADDFEFTTEQEAEVPQVRTKDLFLGALSSGSSGTPKLIWRDHYSWVSAFKHQSKVFNLSKQDRILLVGPLSYTANLNNALHLIYEGGTVVITRSKFPKQWLKVISQEEISAIFMVPAHYRLLLKALHKPLPQIRSLISAGAKLDASTAKELTTYFPQAQVCEYYGASELGHVSYAFAEEIIKSKTTVGRAFPKVKLWIEDGLIWVKSPYLAVDYRPQATSKDLGYLDKDGYLHLTGRQNNLINKAGFKINPVKIETVILQHPQVLEVAAIGIKDQLKEETIALAIVTADSQLTKQALRKYYQQQLPQRFWPEQIIFVEQLPQLESGKLDRQQLKAKFKIKYK
ncbi:acyl--CoA ligase [Natroniella sulfidigena]|uniref:class I adenylate-forming enzyme family protein n=1 Tax=Natroniella sulfidigena TaxID=723921 RepID=UPI002009EC38|nr:class I adenylate-forming enzyme family protein [Natroniella sulfidigena]MCK8816169.1 acyl--CoA ligase [Natroniella sulfidigena]